MPVDVLKIDRAFVRDVNADRQSASMVSAIIALASNLGMEPLAEGIETEEEWRFLAARGCPARTRFPVLEAGAGEPRSPRCTAGPA